nr:MAG TPA: hypothetical protein [Caudoviricetes sp.]
MSGHRISAARPLRRLQAAEGPIRTQLRLGPQSI